MKCTYRMRTARMVHGRAQSTFQGCTFDDTTGLVFIPDHRDGRPKGSGSYVHVGDGVVELDLREVKPAEPEKKAAKAA